MKNLSKAVAIVLLAVPGLALGGDKSCEDVNFGPDVLDHYPNAISGCHGAREKDGVTYVNYKAEVVDVSDDQIRVYFKDKDGDTVSEVVFAPDEEMTATIDGREYKYRDLKEGMTLSLWIPENQLGLYHTPGAHHMSIVSIKDH